MEQFNISKAKIITLKCGSLLENAENICHEKILPFLSVVQALKGSYDIKLGNSEMFNTGEGGVFVAPANVLQKIIHHNGKENVMIAHWVFIDVIVNDTYKFDDIFSFPIVLNKKYNSEIEQIIKTIDNAKNYFQKFSAAYGLLNILASEGQQKKPSDAIKTKIETYVKTYFADNINAKNLSAELFCSVSQVFKYTHKYFGLSPANYINQIRLQQAENMLLYTNKSVTEISSSVGFYDSAYFSKLFKQSYGHSPLKYRKLYLTTQTIQTKQEEG